MKPIWKYLNWKYMDLLLGILVCLATALVVAR